MKYKFEIGDKVLLKNVLPVGKIFTIVQTPKTYKVGNSGFYQVKDKDGIIIEEGWNEASLKRHGRKKRKVKTETKVSCFNCEDDILEEDSRAGSDDELYCEECYENIFSACGECDAVTLKDNLVSAFSRNENEIEICESCREEYYACENCSDIIHSDTVYSYRDHSFCRACYEENYFTCHNCGDSYHNDHYGDDGECSSCSEENSEGDGNSGNIQNYSYKPDPIFFRGETETMKEKFFMGVELEIETPERSENGDISDSITRKELYFKTDGSLTEGFEIVSHPATLDYHLNNMGWENTLTKLQKTQCKSHNTKTCGLHIHVSKRVFTQMEAIRVGIFVNLNCERFEAIARRKQSSFSRFKYIKKGRESNKRDYSSRDTGNYMEANKNDERYEALNYQNRATIEFRLFKGTLKVNTFLATLELTHAVCYFIKSLNSTIQVIDIDKSWQLFIEFLEKNKKKYEMAIGYLKSKNLMQVKKVEEAVDREFSYDVTNI